MCFYASELYSCGDWKWGNMKLRCAKQHRIGEVCGRKFFDHENTIRSDKDCRLCGDIRIKRDRLRREQDNIERWRGEGGKFKASIEKAQRQVDELKEMIRDMESRRMKNQHAIGSRQGSDAGGPGGRHAPGSEGGGYAAGGYVSSRDRHSASYAAQGIPHRSQGGGRHG